MEPLKRKYISVTSPEFKRDDGSVCKVKKSLGNTGVIHLWNKPLIEVDLKKRAKKK